VPFRYDSPLCHHFLGPVRIYFRLLQWLGVRLRSISSATVPLPPAFPTPSWLRFASCKVTATTAPVFMSTACSALCARCVLPVLHPGDARARIVGIHPLSFDLFFFGCRSTRAKFLRRRGPRPLRQFL
jgi:hypothetical protein